MCSSGCPTETNYMEQITPWEANSCSASPLHHIFWSTKVYYVYKSILRKQSLYRPWWFQEVEAPRFHDIWHMKVVRLSAPHTSHLYPPENITGTHRGWVDPRAIVQPLGLCQRQIPMTASRIKSATLQLVAECVNQLQHHMPQEQLITGLYCNKWILSTPYHIISV